MLVPVVVFLFITTAVFLAGLLLLRGGAPEEPSVQLQLRPPKVASAFAAVLPTTDKVRERIKSELLQAGFYRRHTYEVFAGTRNAAVLLWILFVVGLFGLSIRFDVVRLRNAGLVGLVGAILIYSLPGVIVSVLASSRKKRIYHSLPDALDMLTMMMTGGLGLNRSLKRTSTELQNAHPDLSKELSIVHHQAQVGSFSKAIEGFADRMDDPEVTGLSSLIQHSERLGSPMGDALVEYSDGIRRTRRQRAEETGNKRNVLLLFPVILFLAPPIYILLLGPAMLELRDFLDRERRESGVLRQTVSADVTPGILPSQDRLGRRR
jgi:tight adherence protein C